MDCGPYMRGHVREYKLNVRADANNNAGKEAAKRRSEQISAGKAAGELAAEVAAAEAAVNALAADGIEVDIYFSLNVVPMGTGPLIWWPQQELAVPHLSRMAGQYLSCLATSASAERVFSLAGRLHNDYAQNLTEQNLEGRMWAKCNRAN